MKTILRKTLELATRPISYSFNKFRKVSRGKGWTRKAEKLGLNATLDENNNVRGFIPLTVAGFGMLTVGKAIHEMGNNIEGFIGEYEPIATLATTALGATIVTYKIANLCYVGARNIRTPRDKESKLVNI